MNKEEFLNTLRKKLNVLEDIEIEDIISEYEGYIEEKVAVGLTEKDAVKELGDIEEIVSDLLAAYKVKREPEESGFNKLINKISNAIDNFMNSLNDKSAKDIIRVLIEIVIVLILICLLKIPFAMIRDLGSNIFIEILNPLGSILNGLWRFVIEISYIVVAIIFFFKMFEKRYFKNVSERIIDEVEFEEAVEKPKKAKKEKAPAEKDTTEKETKEEKIRDEKKVIKVVSNDHPFIDALTSLCIGILKFFAIMFAVGAIFYLVGMSVAIGVMIYLLCKGVIYVGVLILLVALFMGGSFVLELLINFIFNKKIKALPVFSKLISTIVVLGIGLTISAIEIANTEIIYDSYYKDTKVAAKEIKMEPELTLYNYDRIVIDETLGDTIKIEYIYPDLKNDMEILIELDRCGRGYCLDSTLNHAKYNKQYLEVIIDNLKDKKIYANDFNIEKVVYVTQANYNQLISNREKHYYNNNSNYDSNEMTVTFTRTYNVKDILPNTSELYLNVTLSDYRRPNELVTVKVSRSLAADLVAGNNYEFTFEYSDEPDDNIREIFEECKIIKITQTDKVGLEQVQDPIRDI